MPLVNRREFLKILGLGTAVATIAPVKAVEIIAERVIKKTYDFVPGEVYRHAIAFKLPFRIMDEERKKEAVELLDNWLKCKIHPDYLDINRVEYMVQMDDWDMKGGVALSYTVPENPLTEAGRKLIKRDFEILSETKEVGNLVVSSYRAPTKLVRRSIDL